MKLAKETKGASDKRAELEAYVKAYKAQHGMPEDSLAEWIKNTPASFAESLQKRLAEIEQERKEW